MKKYIAALALGVLFLSVGAGWLTAEALVDTYYFDGHTSITDPGGVWTNDANGFDSSQSTVTTSSTNGTASSGYIGGAGTNFPTITATITQVRARVWGGFAGSTPTASSWSTLSTPTGGWTVAKVQDLETRVFRQSDGIEGTRNIASEIRTSGWSESLTTGPLLTTATGASGTVDFAQMEIEVTYTVPASLTSSQITLTSGTMNLTGGTLIIQ